MKRNYKSWAQSLIFVLIITLALPFGMMGFAENTAIYTGNEAFGTYTLDTSVTGKTSFSIGLNAGLQLDGVDVTVNGGPVVTYSTGTFEITASAEEALNVEVLVRYSVNEVVDYQLSVQQGQNPNVKPGNHAFTLADGFTSINIVRNAQLVTTAVNYMLGDTANMTLGKKYSGLVAMMTAGGVQNADRINYLLNNYSAYDADVHAAIKALAFGNELMSNAKYSEAMTAGTGYLPVGENARIGLLMTAGSGNAGIKDFEDMIFSLPVKGGQSLVTEVYGWVDKVEGFGFEVAKLVTEEEEPGTPVDPVDPEEPPVDPENPPVDPEDPPVDPEDPPVDPENPPVDPEDPPVDPEDPPVDPEDPPVDPVDPGTPEIKEEVTTPTDQGTTNNNPIQVVPQDPAPFGGGTVIEVASNEPVVTVTEEEQVEEEAFEEVILEEVEEDATPLSTVEVEVLPQAGEIPPYAFYAAGMLLLGLGVGLRKKF